jgi:hypothetical protein
VPLVPCPRSGQKAGESEEARLWRHRFDEQPGLVPRRCRSERFWVTLLEARARDAFEWMNDRRASNLGIDP